MSYKLERYKSDNNGTFGRLWDSTGQFLCYTCELPWRNNQHSISCIPVGTYSVSHYNSPNHPNTWELIVPNRSNILIHNGNTENDSQGCILVGNAIGIVNGLPAVLNSVMTLDMLRTKLPSNFTLEITNV